MKSNDTILAADDQMINLEVIKQHLKRLNFIGLSNFAVDGQDCIDSAQEIFDYQISKVEPGQKSVRPIALMLLDLQMPKKNGYQVVKEVQEMYKKAAKDLPQGCELVEPLFVFLTAFSSKSLKRLLAEVNVSHVYEKPISAQLFK